MSQEIGQSEESERTTAPIENGFPIRQLNDIAEKEGYGGARQWYRPIYTMHKWWARRLGSTFRAISLYSLLDDPDSINVYEPGADQQLSSFEGERNDLERLISSVSIEDPDALWELYPKDVRISDKKILDPFMGGGTSLVEASRFGAECHGQDLNPVAWFVTKKEIDAGSTDPEKLEAAYDKIEASVADELKQYYKTPCPNHPEEHDADVMTSFWVKQLDCVSCGEAVSLFGDYRVGKGRYENDDKYSVFCPGCESVVYADDWRSDTTCSECGHEWVPQEGTVSGSSYTCQECGQKYGITDAIQEQDGYDLKYFAIEYYCSTCDDRRDYDKSDTKGYRGVREEDINLYEEAESRWENSPNLHDYVPDESIPEGHMTSDRNPLFDHGYENWKDMFSDRQLLVLSILMSEIENIPDKNIREFFLITLCGALRYNSMMSGYSQTNNQKHDLFKTNSFAPPTQPSEGNIWGAEYGTGTFQSTWEKTIRAVKWANRPTERYIEYPDTNGYPSHPINRDLDEPDTVETSPFAQPIGQNTTVEQGDVRDIDAEDEYDAVITDPPYYDNIIYSEISDFFYVWQKVLLEDEYECFEDERTPHDESIVANPFLDKGEEEFEHELGEAFSSIQQALKQDGLLAFTYHHSDSESWGELLQSLCEAGFEVTATYPITADVSKFIEGEAVEFDIVIIARPASERQPISWNSLRRNIYRTAQKTRQRLEENRDLSRGDIGVVEMGRCFHEYSKHHGKVERAGKTMTAKEVVDEIYGVIQHGSDIGEIDVFLDLLETPDASFNDLNKLCRGTNATPERMEDMRLYRMDDGFKLGIWNNEKRIAYIQSRVDSDEELTNLDMAQFLRYRWEHGKSVSEYLRKWEITDDLRELCEGLADATGDDTYRNILESRLSDY
ncbi:DUF1156 domain-containing protein [Halorussus sp. AFM4]|uniref:DUF1156 domain-containing protein n=1 Tax=Halorussus sp. AFM4 TaxID=3421651 RepID=UPI003EB7A7DD